MEIISELGGKILLLQMPVFGDERGQFIKLFDRRLTHIRPYHQKQLNFVQNKTQFTCRGLHYQYTPFCESKIFRVITGSIQVVAFSIDSQSSVYGQTFSAILNQPDKAIWVPRGFATGYCTLEANTAVLYSSDNDYHPEAEAGLRWDDPAIRLPDLPMESLIFSNKDLSWPDFVKQL